MSDPQPPIDVRDSLAYRVYRAARLLRRDLLAMVKGVGVDVTPEQWFLLNRLRLREGRAQNELGDKAIGDRPNITRILAGLERRGWVRRERDAEDGRRMLVYLTDDGRAAHDAVAGIVPAGRDRLFGTLDPEDVAATLRVLEQLERVIEGDA